jgi:hypothetical protein
VDLDKLLVSFLFCNEEWHSSPMLSKYMRDCLIDVVSERSSTSIQGVRISHSMGKNVSIMWNRFNLVVVLIDVLLAQSVENNMLCQLFLCLLMVCCIMVLRILLIASTWPFDYG